MTRALLLLLLVPTITFAAPDPVPTPAPAPAPAITAPTTEIVAPETAVVPGKQVRLSIKPLAKADNLVSVAYTWVISPSVDDDMDEWPDHTHISFGAGLSASNFHITVVASFVFKNGEEIQQIQTKTETDVAVSQPPPLPTPPQPEPTPTPSPVNPTPPTPAPTPVAPVLPDGKYKLAQYMYNLCQKMPVAQCKALADAMSGIAKTAREGGYQTKGQVIAAIRQADTSALGAALEDWKPLLDHLAATTNTMKAVIVTPQDAGIMCDELATGLYAVANQPATSRGGR